MRTHAAEQDAAVPLARVLLLLQASRPVALRRSLVVLVRLSIPLSRHLAFPATRMLAAHAALPPSATHSPCSVVARCGELEAR